MGGGGRMRRGIKFLTLSVSALAIVAGVLLGSTDRIASAQSAPPTPTPSPFDQVAAIAKLKEQIKGRENEPAPTVFKNLQTPFIKAIPAARLLAVMEIGYAR